MKVRITIKTTQTAVVEVGTIPAGLLRDLLTKNDGTFDGNWSIGDLTRDDVWTTDSVEVEEAK